MAAGAPAVMLAVVFGWSVQLQTPPEQGNSPSVSAYKQDGQVVFEVTNGTAGHQIQRMASRGRLEYGDAVPTAGDGTFRESLGDGPTLVYYRIE